jgi:exodeoxyribonuclease III
MKIISWNVNGLRALHRKGQWDWLIKQKLDIIALQETKCTPEQLPEEVKNPKGYHAFFSHPTNGKKGYSGVAIYSKNKPDKVIEGMGVPEFDNEGRLLGVFFKKLLLLNIYFPNGGGGPVRLDYKLHYYDHFLEFIENYKKQGYSIVFMGDINTAHEAIDLARPKENEQNTGFLPEERAWMDEVIASGYADVFREMNLDKAGKYTYWDMKTGARERNVGWRIDYFFTTRNLLNKVQKVEHLDQVLGSDHCPLLLELAVEK